MPSGPAHREPPSRTLSVQAEPQQGGDAVPGRAGGYPTGPPTVPDVRHSRIRFLSIPTVVTVRITSTPITPAGAELGYPSPVTRILFGRLAGSKSFPSLLPVPRSARPRLPSGGSLGPHFPTFPGTVLGYDCPLPLSGRCACRSLPDTLSAPALCVPPRGALAAGSCLPAPGLLVTRSPSSSGRVDKETGGSPQCPRSPCDALPRSPQTPVESRPLAIPSAGRLPSARATASALAAQLAPSSYPLVHHYTHFGAP
jgi:hypothetical protein